MVNQCHTTNSRPCPIVKDLLEALGYDMKKKIHVFELFCLIW